MAAGKKYGHAVMIDSGSWMDKYSITKAVAETLINVKAFKSVNSSGVAFEVFEADYIGSGTITLSDFAGLPIYSKIWDHNAYKYHVKIAAAGTSTWKSSAAAS